MQIHFIIEYFILMIHYEMIHHLFIQSPLNDFVVSFVVESFEWLHYKNYWAFKLNKIIRK